MRALMRPACREFRTLQKVMQFSICREGKPAQMVSNLGLVTCRFNSVRPVLVMIVCILSHSTACRRAEALLDPCFQPLAALLSYEKFSNEPPSYFMDHPIAAAPGSERAMARKSLGAIV